MKRTLASGLMKALRQLGFLKLNFRQEAPPPEEDRVLTLFRNRAELKKAYGALEDEIYRLKDRIKQQEGATQRVQEMLKDGVSRKAQARIQPKLDELKRVHGQLQADLAQKYKL